jgi:hypothetical protein
MLGFGLPPSLRRTRSTTSVAFTEFPAAMTVHLAPSCSIFLSDVSNSTLNPGFVNIRSAQTTSDLPSLQIAAIQTVIEKHALLKDSQPRATA